MSWLARHYDHRARTGDPRDFLRQVGNTERGQSISDAQFQSLLADLRTRLDLRPDDVLLDLCCGNGVFTRHLAGDVRRAVGLDFSKELIAIAGQHNRAENLAYHVQNVKDLGWRWNGEKFNKVLMNGALQHFTSTDLETLLETVLPRMTEDRVLLFSFVPDFDRREAFRKTLKPSVELRLRRLLGRDLMGQWWKREGISETCARLGLKVEFLDVHPALDGSRYRFDIRMW
jgi:SAM-dependent methyltransferase